jgi:hypothetical protein
VLLGERIELTSNKSSGDVLRCIACELDPWKLGVVIDAPGDRDFIGRVDGSAFQVRRRHRFFSWSRYAPTAVGTVEPNPEGAGAKLRARFRGDPWNRPVFLILLGALFASTTDVSFTAGEILLIAAVIGFQFYALELARRPVRELFRRCTSEPTRAVQWATS